MRKMVLSLAAAGAALVAATPAAAQIYPAPVPYGGPYGAPYGQAYGFHNNYGQVRALRVRLNNIERQINRLDRRDRISDRRADRLREEANRLERRLRSAARYGLSPYELNAMHHRIARLEQRVQYAFASRGHHYGYGYGNDYRDRDRDGRNDRWEDDRGRDHDDD